MGDAIHRGHFSTNSLKVVPGSELLNSTLCLPLFQVPVSVLVFSGICLGSNLKLWYQSFIKTLSLLLTSIRWWSGSYILRVNLPFTQITSGHINHHPVMPLAEFGLFTARCVWIGHHHSVEGARLCGPGDLRWVLHLWRIKCGEIAFISSRAKWSLKLNWEKSTRYLARIWKNLSTFHECLFLCENPNWFL